MLAFKWAAFESALLSPKSLEDLLRCIQSFVLLNVRDSFVNPDDKMVAWTHLEEAEPDKIVVDGLVFRRVESGRRYRRQLLLAAEPSDEAIVQRIRCRILAERAV